MSNDDEVRQRRRRRRRRPGRRPQDHLQPKGTTTVMKLAVTYEDGRREDLRVKPKHIARFETAGYKMDTNGASISWLYRLAWFAKDQPGTFETWLDELEDVSSGDDDEAVEPGPTTPGSPA